jgi:hypothetical protein
VGIQGFAKEAMKSHLPRICHMAQVGRIGNDWSLAQARLRFQHLEDLITISFRKLKIKEYGIDELLLGNALQHISTIVDDRIGDTQLIQQISQNVHADFVIFNN